MFNSIRSKLALLVILPLVFSFFLAAGWIISAYFTYSELHKFEDLLELSSLTGAYIHETQKERGATGVYLGSGGLEFKSELDLQRRLTDLAGVTLTQYWQAYDASNNGEKLKNALQVAINNHNQLEGFRTRVDTLAVSSSDGIALYTKHNANLIRLVVRVAEECGNFEDRAPCAAFASFLQGKEQAGLERAVMAVVFASDQFEPGELELFASLVTAQEAHFNSFLEFSSAEHAEFYKQQLTGAVVDEVQRMRDIAFAKGEASARRILSVQLLSEFGYGGLIHNFKNYVLRNDETYAYGFNEAYTRTSLALDSFKNLPTSEQELRGYATIQAVADSYNANIDLVRDARLRGMTAVEIDQLVKVDDGPALAALLQLANSVSYGEFAVDATHWFATMTQKIDQMQLVEERLIADLQGNTEAARNSALTSLFLVSLLTIIVTVIVVAATSVMGNRIAHPIEQLASAARLVSQGDLDQKIEIVGADEIGGMARAFNEMAGSLGSLFTQLNSRSKELEDEIAERKIAEADNLKLEQQLMQTQRIESIGTLAGGIAHDFNNILQAILGYCRIALDNINKNPDQVSSSLQKVEKAGLRAVDLVSQILTFSHQADVSMKNIALQPLIDESLQFMRSSIPTTIKIETEIDPACAPIMADPTQIHQIVTNLCTNAMHAMEGSTGGVLRVSLSELNIDSTLSTLAGSIEPGSYVQLSVSDTGKGIDPDKIQRIIDPFYTTKEQGKGTGLGLSIVHGISGNMGGGMIVESVLGEGTTVRVIMPAGDLSSVAEVQQENQESVAAGKRHIAAGQGHILLVDDEEDLTTLFSLTLAQLGFTTDAYNDPDAGLKAVEAKPEGFALAILDYTMPRMTGIQLAEKIYAINPDIPVVLATGLLEGVQIDDFQGVNIVEIIKKPFKMSSLIDRLMENGVLNSVQIEAI